MPMNRKLYPVNWDEISAATKTRAGNCCESCGLPNGAIIIRSDIDGAYYIIWDRVNEVWRYGDGTPENPEINPEYANCKAVKIILTVHHAGVPHEDGSPGDPHNKMDNRAENLQALCQRCHLLADQPNHIQAGRVTRWRKKHERIAASSQATFIELGTGESA